jgi:hypothetical protein
LQFACLVEELPVAPIEVRVELVVAGDPRLPVRGLDAFDPVDGGDGVAGEVGRLLAAGDACASRGAETVGASERAAPPHGA